jgi:putative ABC transport system permease protein
MNDRGVPMTALFKDLQLALRTFLKRPGFTVPIVLTLALGIGANTAVFTVFSNLLLKPFAFPEPDRVVRVYDTQQSFTTAPASQPEYMDWRDRNRVFAAIGGGWGATPTLSGGGRAERLRAALVTASFFRVFAASPTLGRWFTDDEDRPGGAKVAIIGEGFWVRRFDRDASIIGRSITLDGVPRTVVGVVPDGAFDAVRRPDVFVPLALAFDRQNGTHAIAVFARLRPGVTFQQAKIDMVALGRRLAVENGSNHGIDVQTLRDTLVGRVAAPVAMLLGMVTVVLLIACANVANLLLARATARRREMAVRMAMGAGRARLARQMLAESVVLAMAGGVLGLGVAWAGVRALAAAIPPAGFARPILPLMSTLGLDWRVLLFALGVSVVTGFLFGLAPLIGCAPARVTEALKDDSGRSSGGRAVRRAGSAIVLAEIALGVVLLSCAGLLLKSLGRLGDQPLGFVSNGVLTFNVSLPEGQFASDESIRHFHREALARLRSIPGVTAAGITTGLPMFNSGSNGGITVDGKPPWSGDTSPLTDFRLVGGTYFEAMTIPLLRGRLLTEQDDERAPMVAVVSQTMAAQVWPGQDPVGKRVQIWGEWRQVVGVVGDVRSQTPGAAPVWEVDVPAVQQPVWARDINIVLRGSGVDPTALMPAVRREMAAIDSSLALGDVQPMTAVVDRTLGWPRLLSILTAVFAVLAALLGAIGTYGLIAYTVGQRRWEFGVRMAVGADRGAVLRLVLRRGLRLAGAGAVVGSLLAVGAGQMMASQLYDVTPADPWVLATACAVVLGAAAVACYLPARAAARVDPVVVLRGE